MEVARNLLSSSPLCGRTHLRTSFSSSSSSPPSAATMASLPTASVGRQFPTSVLLQEQRDEYRPLLNMFKEEKATLERRLVDNGGIVEEKESDGDDKLVQDFERQLLHWPGSLQLLQTIGTEENTSSSIMLQPTFVKNQKLMDVEPNNVVSLAKRASLASKEAAALVDKVDLGGTDVDEFPLQRPRTLADFSPDEERTVRSTRVLERQSKRRRAIKPKIVTSETYGGSRKKEISKKLKEGYDPNDPLRLFLWGPETKQLLSADEEIELIVQIQTYIKLERVKSRIQSQFGREPTLLEWAEAVGLSHQILRSHVQSGHQSREKLIFANLRMVVHIAKQYQGRGLNLQDLLQEGSMGLMRSVEKFKPQAGCRFATYAYWWIRQAIRKAIFQHSRTIRLPENVYGHLGKVMEAKRSYAKEGNHNPSREDIAKHMGITVEKLDKLLYATRTPISMQQQVWADQNTTFQEVTPDNEIEIPDVSVAKQLMRQHVRGLLGILKPRERRIIKLRYGIEGGKRMSLSEIGNMFGLSKERVRQLEDRALYKLKQCRGSHGLAAYADLLA